MTELFPFASLKNILGCIEKTKYVLPHETFDVFINQFEKQFTRNTSFQFILFNGIEVHVEGINTDKPLENKDMEIMFEKLWGKSFPSLTILKKKIDLFLEKISTTCLDKVKPLRLVSSTTKGKIYEICKEEDCDLVMKIVSWEWENKYTNLHEQYFQHVGTNETTWEVPEHGTVISDIERSIDFQKRAGGQTVKIIDHFICESKNTKSITTKYMAIIMEKMNGNLYDLKYPFSEEIASIVIPGVFNIIYGLLSRGICHNNTKMDNFLYRTRGGYIDIYITDFSKATECPSTKFFNKFFQECSMFRNSYFSPNRNLPVIKEDNIFDKQWNKEMQYYIQNYKGLKQ